jgi:YegS/Rv2252/BmrU family lipid kinase
MKVAIIANPYSGKKKGNDKIEEVKNKLNKAGVKTDIFITEFHEHCKEIIEKIDILGYDGIISFGGDGTNYNMLNGLMEHYGESEIPPLGIIPGGSGNSFARDLEIFSLNDGIEAIIKNKPQKVDICRFTQDEKNFYFVNLLGFGFVTDVATTAAKFKSFGDFSYVIGVFHRVFKMTFHKLKMELDGEKIEEKNCFVEICNSRYTGGDMLMAPDAKINDGLMDIVVLRPLTRMSILKTLPKLFKGTHGENPAVKFYKARKVIIETIPAKTLLPDGEIFGSTPTEITILPGRVRYFT